MTEQNEEVQQQIIKVTTSIEKRLEGLNPTSVRYQTLISLLNFRTAWIELGRYLTDIAYGGDYKEWGYDDFEIYCARELGLKKPTVRKLMVSYNYMKSYEPERLDHSEGCSDAPDYQTVALLKKARETDAISDEAKEELHRMAFEGCGDEGVLRKEIYAALKPATLGDDIDAACFSRRKEIDSLLRTARTMRQKIAAARCVPEGVKDRIDQGLLELEALD